MLRGFIFDLDGTLVSSRLNFQQIKQEVGCPREQDLLVFVEQLEPADKLAVEKVIESHELKDAESATLLPGAKEFINWLTNIKTPVALVTRNSATATRIKLEQTGLSFNTVLTREDAPPKPAPDGLLSILQQWQLPSEQVVYIGDYIYDIQAAKNASMLSYLYAPDDVPSFADQADLTFSCWHQLREGLNLALDAPSLHKMAIK